MRGRVREKNGNYRKEGVKKRRICRDDEHRHILVYACFLSFKLFSEIVLMQMGPGIPVSIQSLSKAADNYKKVHVL